MPEPGNPLIQSTRQAGRALVVRFRGRLALGPALFELKPAIERQLPPNATGLVLEMSGVPGIDSAGLGELVAIYSSAARRGVRVALAGVEDRVKQALAITRLDGIFTVCADESSALQQMK